MGKCVNHPNRETSYQCPKHNIYLCEDCLICRDPDIYCKFRSSCPIYFATKKGFNDSPPLTDASGEAQVIFHPDTIPVRVPQGTTLLEAARQAGIYVNASCNGKGSCGKCKLIVKGEHDGGDSPLLSAGERAGGYVLSCQVPVTRDMQATIPEETRKKELKAVGLGREATRKLEGMVSRIQPLIQKYTLQLSPPTLEDTASDLERVKTALSKAGCDVKNTSTGILVMRQIAGTVREDHWQVTVSVLQKKCSGEIVDIRPACQNRKSLGMAVDLGTTSIVVYLVDMETGKVLSAASGHNGQAACGDDVINRIVCSEKNGVSKLKKMAVSTINNLALRALAPLDDSHKDIENIVISGNTVMVHLLLGIDPRYIRSEPYIPTVSQFPVIKAGEIGLKAAHYAGTFVMPGPAGYVGGDIVSGVLFTGFHRQKELTLFIDVGTNGEIVLGNNEFLMTAACSAGPAFEGGGIRWGMRAEDGAIETVFLDPETLEPDYDTVGGHPARGICGSGMIDLLSEMLIKGVLGQDGKFRINQDHPRMTRFNEEPAFILENADRLQTNEDIIFTESDIKSLILSKAAVYAGFCALLEEIGMDFSMIDQLIITGGFGQFLDIEKAVTIGLLPDIDRKKFTYMGNSSIAGAFMALLSKTHRQEALDLSNKMTYVDFSSSARFMDDFIQAQFLPHTDANQFPNVKLNLQPARI